MSIWRFKGVDKIGELLQGWMFRLLWISGYCQISFVEFFIIKPQYFINLLFNRQLLLMVIVGNSRIFWTETNKLIKIIVINHFFLCCCCYLILPFFWLKLIKIVFVNKLIKTYATVYYFVSYLTISAKTQGFFFSFIGCHFMVYMVI